MSKKSKPTKKTSSRKTTSKTKVATKSSRKAPARSVAKKELPQVEKMLSAFDLKKAGQFFGQRRNIIAALVIVIIFGSLYLLKDVFIVAVVNGQPIYRWTMISKLEKQGGQQVLSLLVTETLVKQAVKEAGIVVPQEEIDAQLVGIEENLAAQGFTLEQALAQEGMTKTELVSQIKLQAAVDQLVAKDMVVTAEEIDQYIADNQEFLPADLIGDALREEVRLQLYNIKVGEASQAWVQSLQEQAQILYLRNYGISL
ncbi:MAG: SurA N-terminal domain-containing protein [Candidatus Paceibacterota bacterium]